MRLIILQEQSIHKLARIIINLKLSSNLKCIFSENKHKLNKISLENTTRLYKSGPGRSYTNKCVEYLHRDYPQHN